MPKEKIQYPLVKAIDGDRRSSGFSSQVMNFRYFILSSARCTGMTSRFTYKTREGAELAGNRALQNIVNNFKERKEVTK